MISNNWFSKVLTAFLTSVIPGRRFVFRALQLFKFAPPPFVSLFSLINSNRHHRLLFFIRAVGYPTLAEPQCRGGIKFALPV